jgi:hypothetical protein
MVLDGDHDLFGDGSVVILATPGHTPGHQSLFVKLAKSQPVVLSQGLHAFFRAYYHYKSADWKGNNPHPLKVRTAEEMAVIPTYYVMERDKGMAATVAPFMPSAAEIAACKWLTEADVEVTYGTVAKFARVLCRKANCR